MKFDYSKFIAPDGSALYRPTLPVLFKHGSKFIFVEAVIDSGSDYTILPIELAGELGMKLDAKQQKKFFGAGNNKFNVYPSPKPVEILLRQSGFRTIKWSANIYFAEAQPTILLGNIGFLDQLKLTLDGRKKEIKIEAQKS